MRIIETTQLDRDIADGRYGHVVVFDREHGFTLHVGDGRGGISEFLDLGASLPGAYVRARELGHRPTHYVTIGQGSIHQIPLSVTAHVDERYEEVA